MSYRVKVSLKGVEVEIEGDREFIEAKLGDLSWLDGFLEKMGGAAAMEAEKLEEKPSFVEFASTLEPKSHPQRFLTIAYYLYKWEGKDVTYDDLEEYYRKARWPTPSNPRDVAGDLVREGFIEDAGRIDGRKTFRILQKGIRFVESRFREGR